MKKTRLKLVLFLKGFGKDMFTYIDRVTSDFQV